MGNLQCPLNLDRYSSIVERLNTMKLNGKVSQVVGVVVESRGPAAHLGEVCEIHYKRNASPILAEVVGFKENSVLLMPLGEMEEIAPGSDVVATGTSLRVPVGKGLLGRVIDGLGRPIDGLGPVEAEDEWLAARTPPPPLDRLRITEPLSFGVRAIDSVLTCGKGQRIGIFAGSGVGKSTLLGMIARNTVADVNVIALIGERGREVRDFIEKDLGPEGLARSVVVVATSDQVAVARLRGAMVATSIAEYFRDQGNDVILMMDSVTRVAWAQREVGLAIGEPPTTRGYTPSVFAMLPRLLERSGTAARGSITGLYTVLVDGDDMNEPVADSVRSILDGHIVLSRDLAHRNHYPAIDVLASVSRLMPDVTTPEHRKAAGILRDILATYRSAEDLINIGAYVDGSNKKIDHAKAHIDAVNAFLKQGVSDEALYAQTVETLQSMFKDEL
ncbi:MAG TPA: flagellar protein export ATPase FliI [Armatimonadota bacterium]|jgi:flagellum-specific ATP synthase|nr:flagellar protein export ATPase FliI [Armatimonadota bacterium]HPP73935.1 flagellar protein export ATPase FliI [Armatimonadota bacterium]